MDQTDFQGAWDLVQHVLSLPAGYLVALYVAFLVLKRVAR